MDDSPEAHLRCWQFDDVVVDGESFAVQKQGETTALTPRAFDVLLYLIEHHDRLVDKQELFGHVWKETFVTDSALTQVIKEIRHAIGDDAQAPRYIETVHKRGYRFIGSVKHLPGQIGRIRSLAVLPLANLSGDPQQEYFADGMTEALISALAKIRALKVISRTSVMHYKRTDKRLPQIAHELGVDAVIEGTVLLTGKRVRVSAQLVRAATDEHLWVESYDRDLSDVLSLHADLARAIASEVRAVVTPDEERRLKAQYRVDPKAHEALLRGRYFYAKLTPADADRAIDWFERAIARDASFAAAYAGLAQVCMIRGVPFSTNLSVSEQRQLLTKAKTAAVRALALDEALAEAHAAHGMAILFHDWDWPGAERALERALELEPNHPYAHAYRASLASTVADCARTLAELRRALELDPVNLYIRAEGGEFCYWIRDYAQAIEYAPQTLELDPSYPRAHFVLGRVSEAQGKIGQAITEYKQAGMMTSEDAAEARRALHRGGAAGYHRWALAARLGAMGNRPTDRARAAHPVSDRPFFRARIYARLGEVDKAMRCLERSYEERECLLALLKVQEWWDPLRSDARFEDLVRQVGIP
jgi:TolB-like protein/tetratricopeptide (TPR) repeat protein